MNNIQSVTISRRRAIFAAAKHPLPESAVIGLRLQLAAVGYVLTPEAEAAVSLDSGLQIIEALRERTLANKTLEPLFRNFPFNPYEGMDYFLRRVVGFIDNMFGGDKGQLLSCGHYIHPAILDVSEFTACPICQMKVAELGGKNDLPPMDEFTPLKPLGLIDADGVQALQENLVAATNAWSQQDIEDLKILHLAGFYIETSPSISENRVTLAKMFMDFGYPMSDVVDSLTTPTDVLRFATLYSGGDVSLATNTKFKSMPRALRRALVGVLEKTNSITLEEEIARHEGKWVRLFHSLHIHEYAAKDTLLSLVAKEAYHGKTQSFAARVEAAPYTKRSAILKERPGEFARRLRVLLNSGDPKVIPNFREIAPKLTTRMLLDLKAVFANRQDLERPVLPKGQVAKIKLIPPAAQVDPASRGVIVDACELALNERFQHLPAIGSFEMDDSAKGILLPLANRSASKGASITRGSYVTIPDGRWVRAFIYWHEGTDRTDVDLSGVLMDEDMRFVNHVGFTNQGNSGFKHSGDIQSAPNGAAEFIDIDTHLHTSGYVAFTAHRYAGDDFNEMKECKAGFMVRQNNERGQAFEPKTVATAFTLNQKAQYYAMFMIHLSTRRMYWLDIASNTGSFGYTGSTHNKLMDAVKGALIMSQTRPTAYDLYRAYITARWLPGMGIHKTFGLGCDYDPSNIDQLYELMK